MSDREVADAADVEVSAEIHRPMKPSSEEVAVAAREPVEIPTAR